MSEAINADWMQGVKFYARLTRKNGRRTGQVIVTNPAILNGECQIAATWLAGDPMPCTTWLHPRVEARCEEITAEEATRLDPRLIAYLTRHQRSPEFRAMHTMLIRQPGKSRLQRANPWTENDFPFDTGVRPGSF